MKKLLLAATMAAAFNSQAEPLKGALVGSLDEVDAMIAATDAKGFAIVAGSMEHLNDIIYKSLQTNTTPIIEISKIIGNQNGMADATKSADVIAALAGSNAIVMYDEPLWNTQLRCWAGSQYHCDDVANNYGATRRYLDAFNVHINSAGIKSLHVEAHPVVSAGAPMMQTADYLAVDCYDGFKSCGASSVMQLNLNVYNQLIAMEQSNPRGRQMAIIPGTFTGIGITQFEAIEYIAQYQQAYEPLKEFVGMVGFFAWGDTPAEGLLGAKHYPILQSIMREF